MSETCTDIRRSAIGGDITVHATIERSIALNGIPVITSLPSSHYLRGRFNVLAAEGLIASGQAAVIAYSHALVAAQKRRSESEEKGEDAVEEDNSTVEANLWLSLAEAFRRCAASVRSAFGVSAGVVPTEAAAAIRRDHIAAARACCVQALHLQPEKVRL
jgi:hypothetical protein